MEIEKKMDAVAKAFEDFKSLNEKRLKEIEAKGAESSETKAALEKANSEITKLGDEVKKTQTAMNRNNSSASSEENPAMSEYKAGFNKFLRKGVEAGLSELQTKALSVGSDVDGGYLVLPEMSSEIIKKVYESSPMRQAASVQQISSDVFEIIQDLDEAAAAWVNEVGTRSDTATPVLKKIAIAVHEMYAFPKASQKLLDDAFINVEAWLGEKVADKFARTEATAFISGDGVNKPRGILTYAAGTGFEQIEQIVSGDADDVTADGIISLVTALKAPYKAGAAFMMKRATVGEIRKFKDVTSGQYLWQPALTAGNPDMLLGHPIFEADDMEAEAANSLSVAFGNFKAGYQIVDRFGIRVLRDPFSAKPYVGFYSTKRVGGAVKNFEAIKLLKCST